MLDKLCQTKKVSHSEMADLLGFGELYIGKELKEAMERINAKVGGDAIRFDGENFILAGELKQISEVEHPVEESKEEVELAEKPLMPILQKSLGLIIMIGVCILVAVWLIKMAMVKLCSCSRRCSNCFISSSAGG